MKISHKLILSFLLVASVASVSIFFTLRSYREIDKTFVRLMDDSTATYRVLNGIKHSGVRVISSTAEYCLIRDERSDSSLTDGAEEERLTELGHREFEADLGRYEELVQTIVPDDAPTMESIRSSGQKLIKTSNEIIELKKRNVRGREVLEKKEEFERDEQVFLVVVDAAIQREVGEQFSEQKNVVASIDRAIGQTLIVTALTFMLAIFSGFYVSILISRRIRKLKEASRKVGEGELDIQIDIDSRDEIGDLGRSFNRMIGDLEESRADLIVREKHFRSMIEKSSDGVALFAADGRVLYASPSTPRLLGYTVDEITGINAAELIAPEEREAFGERLAKLVTEPGGTVAMVNRIRHKDGSIRWLEGTFTNALDDPDVGAIVNNYRDVTERKRSEAEREVISEIVQGSTTAANLDELLRLIHRSIGRILNADNCYVALYDARTDLISVPFCIDKYDTVAPPAKLGTGLTGYVLRKGEPMLMTAEVIRELTATTDVAPVGTDPAVWLGVPLRTPDGIIGAFIVQHYEDENAYDMRDAEFLSFVGDQIALAIERKTADERSTRLNAEIDLQRQRLDNVITSVPGVVWEAWGEPDVVSERIDFVSSYVESMLGYTVEEWLTAPNFWLTIVHPDDREQAGRQAAKDFAQGYADGPLEFRWATKDGAYIWIESNYVVITDDEGRSIGLRGVNINVTERKKAEIETARLHLDAAGQRERLNTIIGNVQGIVWETKTSFDKSDSSLHFDFVSDYIETMLGYSAKECLADPGFWLDIVHPDDREKTERAVRTIFAAGKGGTVEFRWIASDGREVWVESRNTIIRDGTNKAVGLRGIAVDITERKNIEHALNVSQELYRDLVENAIDIIYTHDLEGNYTSVNKAGARITGYTREESLTMNLAEIVAPEYAEKARRMIAAKVAGEEVPPYDIEVIAKDGGRVAVEINTRVLYENSVPIAVHGIARDITARKQVETALRENEERFRELVENANDVIYTADMNGKFTSLNRAGEMLTGYTRAEATERSLVDIIAPEYAPSVYERFALTTQGVNQPNFELGIIAKDGSRLTMDISSRAILHDGKPVGVQGIGRDITESLKTRNELQRFNEKLQQSNRELQDFAYVASHDLQEPLRKIQAFSGRLKTKYGDKLEREGLDYLERMRSAASRMQMLIQDLLTFSRVSTKTQPFVSVDLETITGEVLSDLEVKIEETGATVVLNDLPTLDADPMQMRQLMQNLIGNALKFQQQGVAPRINIQGQLITSNGNGAAPQYQISVTDNGIGFDEKHVDKIFAVFQRLHGRTEYEGSGVGLSICRKIAERHNGEITAHSMVGDGATFIVTLPQNQTNPVGE